MHKANIYFKLLNSSGIKLLFLLRKQNHEQNEFCSASPHGSKDHTKQNIEKDGLRKKKAEQRNKFGI